MPAPGDNAKDLDSTMQKMEAELKAAAHLGKKAEKDEAQVKASKAKPLSARQAKLKDQLTSAVDSGDVATGTPLEQKLHRELSGMEKRRPTMAPPQQ